MARMLQVALLARLGLSPSDSGSAILVDPGGGTLLPGEGGPKSAVLSQKEHYGARWLVGSGCGRDPFRGCYGGQECLANE